MRGLLTAVVGLIAMMLSACRGQEEVTAVERTAFEAPDPRVRDSLSAEGVQARVAIPQSTIEQQLTALSELGIEATSSDLGEGFRLDMDSPSLGQNTGTYLTLMNTTYSHHGTGGFATLLPPYERTISGNTQTVLPTVIVRLNPRPFPRLMDCDGNGPDVLKFSVTQGWSGTEVIAEAIITSSNEHWYFVVPSSELTGFGNSMYVSISQDPDKPPTDGPIDVRFSGCNITALN